MGPVLPTLSAHLLQKLPVPFPHLSCKLSGHLTHLLKPNDHTEDLGFQTLQEPSQARPRQRAWPCHPEMEEFPLLWQQPGDQISQTAQEGSEE